MNCVERYFFQWLTNIERHMNAHNNKTFVCTNCNKAFLTNSELKRHQDREAGNHKLKFVKLVLKRNGNFTTTWIVTVETKDTHRRLHEEAKTEHRCDVCDKKFSQVRYLRKHMQVHK